MALSLIIANFCLGLFVGALAYSPIAPAARARIAFRNAWYIGVVFVGLAFFDQLIRSGGAHSEGQLTFVLVGIAVGLFVNRQLSSGGGGAVAAGGESPKGAPSKAPTSQSLPSKGGAQEAAGEGAERSEERPFGAQSVQQERAATGEVGKGKKKGKKRKKR